MFVLDPPYKSLQFPTFLRVHPSSSTGSRSQTRVAVAGNVDIWKGRSYARNGLSLLQFLVSTQMKRLQIIVSIDASVKHCSFWNVCNICRVLSARAVGRAWTGNSRTDSPSNRFYASLATRMFPLRWIKTMFFLHSDNCTTADSQKFCTTAQFTDLVSNRFQPNVFLIIGDHFRLQHSSIPADNQRGDHDDMWSHCFPEGIVNAASPNHIWFQCFRHGAHLQINANGYKLIQNWNCPIFLQVMFFYIYYKIENMNRKGIPWVKSSEGTAMPCGFTRHPQHGMDKITIKVLW